MPDVAVIATGTPVTWKSKIGYTYEGTVTAGPNDDGFYEILTAEGARGNVHRDDIALLADATGEDPDDPNLTAEQRASLRAERARTAATTRVTDAMQSVYATLREDVRRELGADVEGDALDDLRLQAADIVVAEAETLRDGLRRNVEEKRS